MAAANAFKSQVFPQPRPRRAGRRRSYFIRQVHSHRVCKLRGRKAVSNALREAASLRSRVPASAQIQFARRARWAIDCITCRGGIWKERFRMYNAFSRSMDDKRLSASILPRQRASQKKKKKNIPAVFFPFRASSLLRWTGRARNFGQI